MSRVTSIPFREAISTSETGEVFVVLITIDHDDFSEPIRLSTDNKDQFEVLGVVTKGTISNGNNFVQAPMNVVLPTDSEGYIAQATLSVENISRDILDQVRQISGPPSITIQVVLASSPDVVEVSFSGFKLLDVTADAFVISGTLTLGNFLSEPFPGVSFLPSNFPGLF